MAKQEYPQRKYRTCNSVPLADFNNVSAEESPLVQGQALTGAELFRRQSAGLPVGCAIRSFNQINPYLEKFSVYDSLNEFRIRHGMVDVTVQEVPEEVQPAEQKPNVENEAPKE